MIRSLAIALTCALLCGCLISLHPLSSEAEAAPDERLFGVWQSQEDGEDLAILHVGRGQKGMTEAVLIEHRKDGTYKTFRYTAFPTRLDGLTLLNVISPEDHPDQEGYDIVRYTIEGQRLGLALMAEDAVKADIKAGKLKGTVEPGTLGDTTIAASGRELQAYIESADAARLFPKALTFQRIASK